MGRPLSGDIVTVELKGKTFGVRLPTQVSTSFKKMIELSNGDEAGFILYDIAHFINPDKYPDLDPEHKWVSLSETQKLLVLNAEDDIQRNILANIKSRFISAAKDAGIEGVNKPFPFFEMDSWESPFIYYCVDDEFKILNIESV